MQNRWTTKQCNQTSLITEGPTNVIQAEAKILSIIDRITVLVSTYISTIISNNSHPMNEIYEDSCVQNTLCVDKDHN